jgi:hypothetical protein
MLIGRLMVWNYEVCQRDRLLFSWPQYMKNIIKLRGRGSGKEPSMFGRVHDTTRIVSTYDRERKVNVLRS